MWDLEQVSIGASFSLLGCFREETSEYDIQSIAQQMAAIPPAITYIARMEASFHLNGAYHVAGTIPVIFGCYVLESLQSPWETDLLLLCHRRLELKLYRSKV